MNHGVTHILNKKKTINLLKIKRQKQPIIINYKPINIFVDGMNKCFKKPNY